MEERKQQQIDAKLAALRPVSGTEQTFQLKP
jgi:hypothetical protein